MSGGRGKEVVDKSGALVLFGPGPTLKGFFFEVGL